MHNSVQGADSNMLPRLIRPQNTEEERLIEATQEHLTNYSIIGLRVLMAAVRTLGEEEYNDWLDDHNHAVNALEKRDKLLMDSYNRIENKMKLVGATGIEDRLQVMRPLLLLLEILLRMLLRKVCRMPLLD